MFARPEVYEKGMCRMARVGDGLMAMPLVTTNAAAGNQAITVPMILGGAGVFTGAAGAVQYTVAVAADILAAMPDMDIGDTYTFTITNTAAQTATLNTASTGVTYAGFTTANAQTRTGIIEKTSATTIKLTWI
jgi:hypothetical protein